MENVTEILVKIERGEKSAAEDLLPVVYAELRKLASHRLSNERDPVTLQATELVHEAYVRLVDKRQQEKWSNRGHFFAAAAEAMRRILIDNARRKQTLKRGANARQVELSIVEPSIEDATVDLLSLDEALTQLEETWPDKANLVKLRYFTGLTIAESARAMGISESTAERHWTFARAWLFSKL